MELMSVKDAIKLINTLSKYLDEEKIAEILKELDISITYFDHNEITIPDSFSDKLLKIFFIDTLDMDIIDILDEASNNSKILSIFNVISIPNENKRLLSEYLLQYCKIRGYYNIKDYILGGPSTSTVTKLYQMDKLDDVKIICLDDIYISSICPINADIVRELVEEYINTYDDNFEYIVDNTYINIQYIDDYVEDFLLYGYDCIDLRKYMPSIISDIEKNADELKDECGITVEDLKSMSFIKSKEIADFLMNNTDILELMKNDLV